VFPDPVVPGNAPPTVLAKSTVDSGALPLTVGFDTTGTTDPDGDELGYTWDFTGDGVVDAEGPAASWTFTEPGQHTARVTVTDSYGAVSVGELPVVAGNSRPAVVIESPADGSVAAAGEPVSFRVAVTDPDGAVDCTKVVLTHDARTEVVAGPDCTGIVTPAQPGALSARYTDAGAPGVPALTGSAEVVLQPREHQVPAGPARGGWSSVPHVNLAGVDHLSMELAAGQAGATMTVHADSPVGPVVASFPALPATDSYQWFAADVVDPGGVRDLYFVPSPDLSARLLRFQTVPTVTVAAPTGWQTTEVPLTVTAAPLWDQQVSLDGGATWTPARAPVVLSADGTHTVLHRAVDAAGRTSQTGTATVSIDRTAPALTVPGREHDHLGTLEFGVADAGSGVAAFAATIDGAPVASPVELWRLASGVHQLSLAATDLAGNTVTHTAELEITASLPGLLPLLERFDLPFVKVLIMRLQLMGAARAYDAGRAEEAAAWVRTFHYSASLLRDPGARAALTADATYVLGRLD
jgi:PKD repeat protein